MVTSPLSSEQVFSTVIRVIEFKSLKPLLCVNPKVLNSHKTMDKRLITLKVTRPWARKLSSSTMGVERPFSSFFIILKPSWWFFDGYGARTKIYVSSKRCSLFSNINH